MAGGAKLATRQNGARPVPKEKGAGDDYEKRP